MSQKIRTFETFVQIEARYRFLVIWNRKDKSWANFSLLLFEMLYQLNTAKFTIVAFIDRDKSFKFKSVQANWGLVEDNNVVKDTLQTLILLETLSVVNIYKNYSIEKQSQLQLSHKCVIFQVSWQHGHEFISICSTAIRCV